MEAHDAPGTTTAEPPASGGLLEVKNLEVRYGRRPVLFDLSLTVGKGEIVAMFGHNGAGKTTTLNAIFGRVKPSGGSITFDGKNTTSWGGVAHVKEGITLIPAERFTFQDLTVLDNLRLGAYHESNRKTIETRIAQVYETFPILKERSNQLAGTFSGGQQRMLSVGIAMMTGPRLLLLDEPSLGLSPNLVEQMMKVIRQLASETDLSVLMVEQNVVQTLGVVDRCYFVRSGRVILEERSEELAKRDHYWDLF